MAPIDTQRYRGNVVDAIVVIAGGPMSRLNMVDLSLESIRRVGDFNGPIYVLTDDPSCFQRAAVLYNTTTINILEGPHAYHPDQISRMHMTALKAALFKFLPSHIDKILYMDVDVLVAKSLDRFFSSLEEHFNEIARLDRVKRLKAKPKSVSLGKFKGSSVHLYSPDYAMFLDAAGHAEGSCEGCEKWHTGVIWMQRGSGLKCLESWRKLILSQEYAFDQQALDKVEEVGLCPNAVAMNNKHLLFARDIRKATFQRGYTFVHLTASNRADHGFYRDVIIPYFRASIRPRLSLEILRSDRKDCRADVTQMLLEREGQEQRKLLRGLDKR
jgi:hypothetical protein